MKLRSDPVVISLVRFALAVLLVYLLFAVPVNLTVQAGRGDLFGPVNSGKFGAGVFALPNGNFVVIDPEFSPPSQMNIGAVYLYDGATQALISRTIGVTDNDRVGSGGIQVLEDGNFVIASPQWNTGVASKAGAVTACSASTGCPSTVTAENSLVGSHTNDWVGASSTNDYSASPPPMDFSSITPMGGSAFLVRSPLWDNEKGAVTYCASISSPGCLGEVSASNSLVGSTGKTPQLEGDYIGLWVIPYPGGGYIVLSPWWTNNGLSAAGAVIPCPASGCTGEVSTSNSLHGESRGSRVGSKAVVLSQGGFVVDSYGWGSGVGWVGAVTYCASLTDPRCVGKSITVSNSLLGKPANLNGQAGSGALVALPDGGYLIGTPHWTNASGISAGAVTYCSVNDGNSACTGLTIREENSLTGDQKQDGVGDTITLLPNGAFLASSSIWHNYTGAVTYCSSPSACMGQRVSAENSLVGGNASVGLGNPTGGDSVGRFTPFVLSNGDYVVFSPSWDPVGSDNQLGAVTFCPSTGCTGYVDVEKSLIGSKANDRVGQGLGVQLPNGAILIPNTGWGFDPGDGTAIHANAGAVTYCASPQECMGTTVKLSNSLVSDQVGAQVNFTPIILSNGSYLIFARNWANGTAMSAGAVTWCPETGCKNMIINETNSLVGSHTDDMLAWANYNNIGLKGVKDGLYVVQTSDWHNDSLIPVGAVTLCSQSSGCRGPITADNSVLGYSEAIYPWEAPPTSFNTYHYDSYHHRLLVGMPLENRVAFFKLPQPPSVTTLTASDVNSTSATLRATINPNLEDTTVTFEYGLTIAYGSTLTVEPCPLNGSTDITLSQHLDGLSPNTRYYFRAKAINETGVSYGQNQTFVTSVPPAVITGAASNISPFKAKLNGTVVANNASTVASFEYGLTSDYGTTVAIDQNPVVGTSENPVSKEITGLTPGTTYHYRIVAVNSAGTTKGLDQSFTTAHEVIIQQEIELSPGWNLISLEVEPTLPQVEHVLESISNRYDRVLSEKGIYSIDLPGSANTLKELHVGQGYYVRVTGTTNVNLIVNGLAQPANSPIALHQGWNWIGYLPNYELPVGAALTSVLGKVQLVHSADSTFNPFDIQHSTLTDMHPGKGYLIFMNEPGELVYPTVGQEQGPVTENSSAERSDQPARTPYFTVVYGRVIINEEAAPAGTVVEVVTARGELVGRYELIEPGILRYTHVYGGIQGETGGFLEGEKMNFRVNRLPLEAEPPIKWASDHEIHEVTLTLSYYPQYLPNVGR